MFEPRVAQAIDRLRVTADPGDLCGPTPEHPAPGYVHSSASEDQVVRTSLFLRLLGRRREAMEVLLDRLGSGLDCEQSQVWLAHYLRVAGEKKAAAALQGEAVPTAHRTPSQKHRSRLRYGIVMLTVFGSPVFRASLDSLCRSDFDGEIVVVEDGYQPGEACRETCEGAGVGYIKRARWEGSAAALNEGIGALAADTDIVLFVHNDILWPPEWFRWLDRAWDIIFDTERVGLLNLGYLQFTGKADLLLRELFAQGEYGHLRWLLTAIRDTPWLKSDRVQMSHPHAGERLFGLARDPWNDWVPDARFMTGRFSVAASFPRRTWQRLGGFDSSLPYGFDLELQMNCVTDRRWVLFANNPPLIHLASTDMPKIDAGRRAATPEVQATLPAFQQKYGVDVQHFLNVWFSESTFIYADEITRAANALRFDDVDFVFDDFAQRLRERTLENCELTWCRMRSTCPYATTSARP